MRIISIVICITIIISIFLITETSTVSSAKSIEVSKSAAGEYNLADNIQDGVILHAWNVSLNNIKAALPDIAKAGFTTVQTSPIQQPKDYNSSWTDVSGQWWKLYQPLSLGTIATNSWIGTKSELQSLCSEADKYGIKIICDIVVNHLANNGDTRTVHNDVRNYESEIYNNQGRYFHSYNDCNDSSIRNVVQGNLGMPDLNTGDSYVQERVINLLKECIDCGVDGFRFDAAKHIETPDDGDCASNFWPNVLNTTTSYAKTNYSVTPYYYGEILTTCGNNRSYSSYSKYMSVVDNVTGNNIMWNINNNNASSAATPYFNTGLDPSKIVLWAESHDTYADDSTSNVDQITINKAYSLDAARNKATSLYFIRTDGAKMGSIGSVSYKSATVSAANHFHNYFVGSEEYLSSYGNYAICERYNDSQTGVVIVNCGGTSSNISGVQMQKMKDGSYIDAVTGNTFTVSSSKLSGTIGSSGVAVIYDPNGSYIPPTQNEDAGFYLVGNIGGENLWPDGSKIPDSRKFMLNTEQGYTEEYMLKDITLHTDDEIKVVYFDGTSYTWFPASDNYKVTKSTAGKLDMYFRPYGDGDGFWTADGYFFFDVKEAETEKEDPTKETSYTTESKETSYTTETKETTKRIYLGVVDYLKDKNMQIHYWNLDGLEGDTGISYSSGTKDFSVGSDYWNNQAQTFYLAYADIPDEATNFKVHILNTDFSDDGWAKEEIDSLNMSGKIACIFEYGSYVHNILNNYNAPTEESESTKVTEATNVTEPTTVPTESTLPRETTNIDDIKDGYYLLGTFNGISNWQDNIDINNRFFVNNTKGAEEYILYKYLHPGDQMKVVKIENGIITKYYKSNEYTNYIINASSKNKEGNYKILFRPKGKSNWLYTYINATKINGSTIPTYPSQPTEVTEPSIEYIYGDVDNDKSVTITDCTLIQCALAKLVIFTPEQIKCASVTGDAVSINDATTIQLYLASLLPDNKVIGRKFYVKI